MLTFLTISAINPERVYAFFICSVTEYQGNSAVVVFISMQVATEVIGLSGPNGVFATSHVIKANSIGTEHVFLRSFSVMVPALNG